MSLPIRLATMAMTTRYSAAATQRQRWSALKNLRMARTSKTRATAPTGSPMAGPIKGSAPTQGASTGKTM